MSTISRHNEKVVLPRCGPDEFWGLMLEHYAGRNRARWKELAMLALREDADWPVERIALAFSHTPGHVSRCLRKIKGEIRDRFALSAEWRRPSEGFSDPRREE